MTLNRLATTVRSKLLIPDTTTIPVGARPRPIRPQQQLRQLSRLTSSAISGKPHTPSKMGIHHLMVGTWTPPGAIFTFAFDDEALTLKLVRRTEIAHDEPISWMTFDVSQKDKLIQKRNKENKRENL